MYELKTRATRKDVMQVISQIEQDKKQADARMLLEIFKESTGHPPVVWGDKLIGFGRYKYRYSSGHQGEMFRVGFAVSKTRIVLHLYMDEVVQQTYLKRLGKATAGKSCIYVNKLSDIDLDVLREMIHEADTFIHKTFE